LRRAANVSAGGNCFSRDGRARLKLLGFNPAIAL
jgi:hypothetical protein